MATHRRGAAATYARFAQLARDGSSEAVLLKAGITLHEEASALRMVCHSPDDATLKKMASQELPANQISNVLEILWGGHRWILAADLPAEEWQRLPEGLAAHRCLKLPPWLQRFDFSGLEQEAVQ